MLTVSKLARACGLSRTAVLYYESIGLLRPASRSEAGYRWYGDAELSRLRQICVYRAAGLTIRDIRDLLVRPKSDAAGVLHRRLEEIAREVDALRQHQQAIIRLLPQAGRVKGRRAMTKEKWVSIMRDAGFSEDDMHRWHVVFERTAPDDHERFLEFLHIPPAEIAAIRKWSRGAARA